MNRVQRGSSFKISGDGALCSHGHGFEHGDGDVVQITKTHRPVACGMMAGRAHRAENIFTIARGVQGIKRGGRGRAGVSGDVFAKWRVGVEILRFIQAREMFDRMRAENLRVVHFARRGSVNWQFGLALQNASVLVMRSGRSG